MRKEVKNPNQQTELERLLDRHAEQISEEIKMVKVPRGETTSVEIQIGKITIKVEVNSL